ncbi:hypothetical protein IL54_3930 [Sphingobium sp. ba1]|nr:hypothetical protein IL54_3930 [Sphingobium sp. ba1]
MDTVNLGHVVSAPAAAGICSGCGAQGKIESDNAPCHPQGGQLGAGRDRLVGIP